MGDHFVFLVDRLLTESTLEAAIESRNLSCANETVIDCSSSYSSDMDLSSTPRKMVECRICQDEDFDSNMETPCSCCGSLKYAHRRCVQRWCNEKGDIVCEICHQQFRPGYTAPPPVFRLGGIPANFRGHWQIGRRDVNDHPQIITVVSSDHNFLDQEYDEYAESTARSVLCFRSIALVALDFGHYGFTLFFPLYAVHPSSDPTTHAACFCKRSGKLPVTRVFGRNSTDFIHLFLLVLRASGIVVPMYFILRGMAALVNRQRRLASSGSSSSSSSSFSSSDEEAGPTPLPPHTARV
ncbi:hypothetical protein OSB04_018269 [Centaurea solstitialis]|uniref:RING-CH-type domain-containing protein n=1 Tax=Centaurea solstitialis TaxID=347529 RepID=A0AA38WLJ6_9ASTR|nr:hypothetical protein OSB04_018269 [Centaurea solstitialis]